MEPLFLAASRVWTMWNSYK